MKKYSHLYLLVLIAFGSSANAAESEFDGAYVGVNLGYANGDSKGTSYCNGNDEGCPKGEPSYYYANPGINSELIGGFVGFNKRINNNTLLGLEADYEFRNGHKRSFENLIDSEGDVVDEGYQVGSKFKNSASIRAKLGYLINNNQSLIYATGGLSLLKMKNTYSSTADGDNFSETHSNWHTGWTAGLGLEHFVNRKLSIKGEYRYSDFAHKTDNISDYEEDYEVSVDSEHSVRLGVAYHF